MKYAYQLEGFDENWLYSEDRLTKVSYTNVASGDYRFLMKVVSPNNKDLSPVKALVIHVSTPFWDTWWFKLLYISLICALTTLVIVLRLRSIKARNRLLEKKVAAATLEISLVNDSLKSQNEEVELKSKRILALLLKITVALRLKLTITL